MVIATKPQVSFSSLTILENISLLGSVAGTVILIASRQIAYAPAPLYFSALLSLVNRQRIEQLIQQSNAPRITQVDPGISREVKSLHDQVKTLPLQVEALRTTTELLIQKSQDSIVPTLKQHLEQLPGYWEHLIYRQKCRKRWLLCLNGWKF